MVSAATDNVSVAVPELPKLEVITSVTFTNSPLLIPTTSIVTVQEPSASNAPDPNPTSPEAAFATTVPPHVLVTFGTSATTMPVGNTSRNVTDVAAINAVLLISNDIVETSPISTDDGTKDFVNVGVGAAIISSVAVAVPESPNDVDNASVRFTKLPTEIDVTSTSIVQLSLSGMVPDVYTTDVASASALNVPPVHVVDAFGGVATIKPDGNGSLIVTSSASINAPVLFMVNVNVATSPWVIDATENDFSNVGIGAAVISNVAVAVPELPKDEVISSVKFTRSPVIADVTSTVIVHVSPVGIAPLAYVTAPAPTAPVSVPPVQVVDAFAGSAMNIPVGNVSTTLTFSASISASVFANVMVNVVTSPCGIAATANALSMVGIGAGVILIESVAVPEFPKLDVKSPVKFTYVSTNTDVVVTVTVHVPSAATVPPVYVTLPLPAMAVNVPPVQVVATSVGVTTVNPVGNVSVKSTLVAGINAPLLSSVRVNNVVSPCSIALTPNALVKPITGAAVTSIVSVAVPELPKLDVKSPVTLTYVSAKTDVTVAVTVHDPSAGISPPEYAIEPDPATAVNVPPVQVVAASLGVTMVKPVGNVSVNAALSASKYEFTFDNVSVNDVVSPCGIVVSPNTLVNVGSGVSVTSSVALPVPELPNADVISPVVFTYVFATTDVTSATIVQIPLAGIAPVSVIK